MIPQLLYHSSSPSMYPTNTCSSLLVLRFSGPVRVSSVRITPEGVRCPDGSGVTYPAKWTGQLLFNISSSNPVNALVSTNITYNAALHPVDYPIDMPRGTTSRMMMLRAPVEKLSISVYGYTDEPPGGDATQKDAVDDQKPSNTTSEEEDSSWLWRWAGDSQDSLIDLLNAYTRPEIMSRTLECLDLLSDLDDSIIPSLIERPDALEYLFRLPASTFSSKITNNYKWALHPSVEPLLLIDSPFTPLLQPDTSARHDAAWQHLSLGKAALTCLVDTGVSVMEYDLMRVEKGEEKSNLTRLLEMGEKFAQEGDAEGLNMVLNLLDSAELEIVDSTVAQEYLARTIPRLSVIAIALSKNGIGKGNDTIRSLKVGEEYARQVVNALLLCSTEIIDGKLTFPIARNLAKPYLPFLEPSDPLRIAFHTSHPSPTTDALSDTDPAARALARLSHAISSSSPSTSPSLSTNPLILPSFSASSSSITHILSPSTLLSFLAPQLTSTLSTAISPPFGIRPAATYASPELQGANAWAGKVYTSHEFRSRELVGLGIGPGGRAASKHVDEYA
ncbi:hypothetical protein CNBG_9253 [Cryptococcus deuterogattii R265]|uniref:Uncharacterized protein n=1 Tax=Cryptococcus deuterogattii (strain R265) TaxID=294750 RepID=A0A0L6DH76_CRYD2|nr:hypothetical protein I310_06292 [Cryptococcus deuterogattii CA1014]KNX50040.1 hypothetical protein CNBG_9253 [Cryptococcus deuterogattii R265]